MELTSADEQLKNIKNFTYARGSYPFDLSKNISNVVRVMFALLTEYTKFTFKCQL